jgi:hypothetical protein
VGDSMEEAGFLFIVEEASERAALLLRVELI